MVGFGAGEQFAESRRGVGSRPHPHGGAWAFCSGGGVVVVCWICGHGSSSSSSSSIFFVIESHEKAFGECTFCFLLWIEAFWGVYFSLWSLGGLGMHEAEMLQSRA